MTIPAPLILLVDDDPDALEILCRFLDLLIHHADIVTVNSGTAALAVMASREVALVIADYRMPEMNCEDNSISPLSYWHCSLSI